MFLYRWQTTYRMSPLDELTNPWHPRNSRHTDNCLRSECALSMSSGHWREKTRTMFWTESWRSWIDVIYQTEVRNRSSVWRFFYSKNMCFDVSHVIGIADKPWKITLSLGSSLTVVGDLWATGAECGFCSEKAIHQINRQNSSSQWRERVGKSPVLICNSNVELDCSWTFIGSVL